jgi:ribonucleoside-diphosphate reductase alpha chain
MGEKNLKSYLKQDIEKSTLQYFKNDELATDVWITKYCLKDEKKYYELNPDDMHRRIAKELARIEAKYKNPRTEEEIYERLKDFKRIIPQGSPMSGIGNDLQVVSLSNCFVIGNKGNSDSYGGILKIDQEQVQLMKRRGGVGHDLSHIRPTGSPVKNSAITSTGIVPFMERYSNSTNEVAQDGRRGALMLSVSINHPDSEKFIDAKLTQGKVTGANISIKLTDEFMERAINLKNDEFWQTYPIDLKIPLGVEYDELIANAKENELVRLPNVGYLKKINAQKLWKKIIYNAWKSAEPGILFWDTIIRESIPDCYIDLGFKTISTNPCGEIPLCPYDSCRLLAINLFSYVKNPFTKEAEFDWQLFINDVIEAMRYMDDIIDLELEKIDDILAKIESDPEEEITKLYEKNLWINIKEMTIKGRRTGLGVTAEGDCCNEFTLWH